MGQVETTAFHRDVHIEWGLMHSFQRPLNPAVGIVFDLEPLLLAKEQHLLDADGRIPKLVVFLLQSLADGVRKEVALGKAAPRSRCGYQEGASSAAQLLVIIPKALRPFVFGEHGRNNVPDATGRATHAAQEPLALALRLGSRPDKHRNGDTMLGDEDALSGLSHPLDHRKAGRLELRDLNGNH